MIRILSMASLGMVILLVMLAVGAAIIGRGMQTEIVTVVTSDYTIQPDIAFRLVDLNRRLSVTIPVPADNIRDVNLVSGQSALILTRAVTNNFSHYGLHYFNVASGDLRSLINHDAPGRDSIYQQSANIFQNFSPVFSPDGTMIAFVDPIEQTVNVYNLETGAAILKRELQYTTQFVPFGWSPDSTQLAYRELTGALVVLDVDGSSVREHNLGSGQPMWSQDGRWILMMRGGGAERAPIRIIDAATGEQHPFVDEDIAGTSVTWSCDHQWLSYSLVENGTLEVHLLNLETGERYDPHDETALSGINIGYFYWLPDCQRMALTGSREYRQVSQVMVPPLMFYVLDTRNKAAHLLTDNGGFVGSAGDGIYYYQNTASSQKNALYRLNEQTNQAEWIADIPAINSWLGILDQARGVYVDYNTWELRILDFHTGITHNLLPGGNPVHSYVTWETG